MKHNLSVLTAGDMPDTAVDERQETWFQNTEEWWRVRIIWGESDLEHKGVDIPA